MLYFGTGNPQPVIAGQGREGANLYTECIIALNPDTGKLAWYFQPSPHDTHDWDAVQTPVLFDGEVNGQPRKLLAQASRNGWFFVLDRATGKNIVSASYVQDQLGQGRRCQGPADSESGQGAEARWRAGDTRIRAARPTGRRPAFNPDTGLFYVNAARACSVYYLYDDDDKPEGWGGNDRGGYSEAMLQAIDYKTGKVRWSHKWEGGARSGLLTTAGNLVFTTGPSSDVVALNASTGEALWHAGLLSGVTNAPITYELDGTQYLTFAGADVVYCFAMRAK